MNCPDEIAKILLQIIEAGVVSARAAAWGKRVELAALETDHVHNLPDTVRRYASEKLSYYWNTERPSYINAYTQEVGQEPRMFTEHWMKLEPLVPKE